jgi:transketolase
MTRPWTRSATAMREAFVRALSELASEDPSVMLVNGDLGFGVLDDFVARFPNSYVNAGIAEQNMTALACGMALEGARAYTYSIANFPTLRCLEQLRNDVCYHAVPVTVVAVGGGFSYGPLGMSHFATEDLAVMRAMPGMTVIAPSDPWQAYELTRQLHERGQPAYLRIDKDQAGNPPAPVELGKIRLVRDGDEAIIFATGAIVGEAVAAADELGSIAVADVHTVKPLDIDGICSAADGKAVVVTVEEHSIVGGLGSAIAEALLEGGVRPRGFRRLGLGDCFPETVGDQAYLRERCGLDRRSIATTMREMLES